MDPTDASMNASQPPDDDLNKNAPTSAELPTKRPKISFKITRPAAPPPLPKKHPLFDFRKKVAKPVPTQDPSIEKNTPLPEASKVAIASENKYTVNSASDSATGHFSAQPSTVNDKSQNRTRPLDNATARTEADHVNASNDRNTNATKADLEDWETMKLPELPLTAEESLKRKRNEVYQRSHPLPKAEIEMNAAIKRLRALDTPIPPSNKGYKMMKTLGYKPGTALGVSDTGITEPINVLAKKDKHGIGANEPPVKRTAEELYQEQKKREKQLEEATADFRARQSSKFKDRSLTPRLITATGICQTLDKDQTLKTAVEPQPLKTTNVIWRSRARDRLVNIVDCKNSNNNPRAKAIIMNHILSPDPELEAYENLPVSERFDQVLTYLRKQHYYCFWCRRRYENEWMEGCPGYDENDH